MANILKRMRGGRLTPAVPGDYPLGVIGRTDEQIAWDTQYTSGLSSPGSVVAATLGALPGGSSEDSVGWYLPAGTFSLSNLAFSKPVFFQNASVATLANCSMACAASGATGYDFYVLEVSGASANVTLDDCYLDLTNVGLSRAAGIYHSGGALTMRRCKAIEAAANFITVFDAATACTIEDTYFLRFGCRPFVHESDPAQNTHCEPIHHRAGTLTVTKTFFDNRGNTNPAATVTASGVYTEASAVTIASTLNAVLVDGTIEAVASYPLVLDEKTGGQATMTVNGGAFDLGTGGGFIDKGSGTTLAGSNSLNINTGALLTPSYG